MESSYSQFIRPTSESGLGSNLSTIVLVGQFNVLWSSAFSLASYSRWLLIAEYREKAISATKRITMTRKIFPITRPIPLFFLGFFSFLSYFLLSFFTINLTSIITQYQITVYKNKMKTPISCSLVFVCTYQLMRAKDVRRMAAWRFGKNAIEKGTARLEQLPINLAISCQTVVKQHTFCHLLALFYTTKIG